MNRAAQAESEWVQLVRDRYEPEPDAEMSYEEEGYLLCLLNAPEQYENEDEMLAYAKARPEATMKELVEYWDSITPDGLPPGDDGADLLDDE